MSPSAVRPREAQGSQRCSELHRQKVALATPGCRPQNQQWTMLTTLLCNCSSLSHIFSERTPPISPQRKCEHRDNTAESLSLCLLKVVGTLPYSPLGKGRRTLLSSRQEADGPEGTGVALGSHSTGGLGWSVASSSSTGKTEGAPDRSQGSQVLSPQHGTWTT